MSNQFNSQGYKQDYRNILSAFSVKKYTASVGNDEADDEGGENGIRVCLQLLKPEHKNLYYSGQENARKTD